ncbi:MAG: EAL domain-containing protein [Candidatus Sumerlaeaceae bacterium]
MSLYSANEEMDCLLRLSAELGGAASTERIAVLVQRAFDELWQWDACFMSVRRLGRAWYDTILQIDTVNNERRAIPARRFEAREYQHVGDLLNGRTVLINREPDYSGPTLRRFGDVSRPSASLMYAAMRLAGQPMGIVSLQSYTVNQFSESDLGLLQRIADVVAPSIKRCMAERRSAAMAALGTKLSSALSSVDASRIIVNAAQELLGWDACLVDLYHSEIDLVEIILNVDTIEGAQRELPRPASPLKPSAMMRRVLAGSAQLILRTDSPEKSADLISYGDMNRASASILYVPIRTKNSMIGVLSIQSYTARAYDEEDLDTLQMLADHCAGALERTRTQKALEVSEERFRDVVESLGEGLIITDMKDVVQYVNSRFLELSGYSPEEMLGHTAYELLLKEEDVPAMLERLDQRSEGQASRYVAELRKRDGTSFWVEVSGTPLRDADGAVIGTIGAMTDVSARRRAELEQAVVSELSAQLAASMTAGEIGSFVEAATLRLWPWDAYFLSLKMPDGRFSGVVATDTVQGNRVHWPSGGENLNKLDPSHPIRSGIPLLINREPDSANDLPRYGDVQRCSESLLFAGLKIGDETVGVISIQSYTRGFFYEKDLQLLQHMADIIGPTVGRCLAEEAFRRSEAELRSLFSAMSDIIIVYDRDCRYVKVAPTRSPRLQKLQEPLIGKTAYEVLPIEIAQRIHEYVRTCLDTKRPMVLEYRAGKGSAEAWFSASVGPLTNDTVVFVAHDITERMRTAKTRGVLAELGEKLSACVSPEQAAASVLSAADELFGWDAAFLDAMEPGGPFKTLVGYDFIEGQRTQIYSTHDGTPSLNTQKTLESGPQLILRRQTDESEHLVGFGAAGRPSASLMFVAIRRGSENFGILSIQSYTPDLYSMEDLRLLQVLADYCSSALHRTFTEVALRQSEERLRLLVSQMPVVMWTTDLELRLVIGMGSSFERLGIPLKTALGTTLAEYFGTTDEEFTPITMHRRALLGHNSSFEIEWHGRHLNGFIEPLRNATGEIIGTIGVAHDVTERKEVEMQLHHGAFHDSLTDLPNRALFMDWLSRALAHTLRRPAYKFAVLFLDLDRFKNINDSLGHSSGDRLLVEVSERLRLCLRTEDMVARIGGDEFAVFVDDIDDVGSAVMVARKILTELERPFRIDNHDVFTGTSIGVAVSTTGYQRPDDLLRDADAAMYRAKAAGKGRYEIFDAAMHARVIGLLKLEGDLRKALERTEFVLYYQPIVSLRTGTVAGFEALIRWQHPVHGLLSPSEFIPLAEETGLIVPIGQWSLREACRQMHAWHNLGTVARSATISVNVSARQFREESLVSNVKVVLQETGLAPQSLKLEITESTIMENAEESTLMLLQLRALDVQLHVDDFGTGYSSLAYLNRFPIDALKIDKSFVHDLGVKEESLEIVRTIVAMAQTLGMEAVAEGVETAEQLLQLRALGCKHGQGYYFAEPQEPTKVEHLLSEHWRI